LGFISTFDKKRPKTTFKFIISWINIYRSLDINLFSFTQSLDKNRTKKQLTPTLPKRHAVGVAMSSFGILFNFRLLSGFPSLTFPQGPLEQGCEGFGTRMRRI